MIQVFNNVGYVRFLEEKENTKTKAPFFEFKLPIVTGYGDKEKTTWYKCLVTQPLHVERFRKMKIKDGSFIQVVGAQEREDYTKKDGTPGFSDVVFLLAFGYVHSGKKQDSSGSAAGAPEGAAEQAPNPAQPPANPSGFEEMDIGDDDGDLPF